MAEKKTTRKKPGKRAIHISVWSMNGSPVPEEILTNIEDAIEKEKLLAFNQGHRLLSQTNRA